MKTLYDITQLLESAERADERVLKVLERLRELVPYQQCAVLEARLGCEPRVLVVPPATPDEKALLTIRLLGLFGHLVGADPPARDTPARPDGAHLAVPLTGLDELTGLLFVRRPTGEFTDVHLRALSIVAAKLAAYFTMLRAHAELAERGRELAEARRTAEDANRAKDEFLALVSHELKTPLNAILAGAHLLGSTTADAAERARALEGIERAIRAQDKIVDDILELACVATAALHLELRVVEPARIITTTVEGLRLEAERKSIRLVAELDRTTMSLVLDPDRIGQILSHLIARAIRVTPSGGLVVVRLERATGYARILVCDSGGGISREELPHVFDRFRGERGLEVGLAIVKDLVELHGGRVRAESAGPDEGATFTIELPRTSEARGAPVPLPPRARTDECPLLGVRVLLVDRDPDIRDAFQSVLHNHGAEVTAVASAAEVLAALERSRPDVLLCGDLAMPLDSVYDLIGKVAARECPLPVASFSAWRLEEKERMRAAGFRMHLARPVDAGTLVDAVADLAGRWEAGPPHLFALQRESGPG